MDKDVRPVPFIYDQASVVLPLDEDAFKDFIVSLLGQPETIQGRLKGSFEINIGDFQNINQLLDNRIATQNLSSLLEFRAKIFFDNDTSISFNGVQSFLEHNEMRPLICEGFIFTWSYLVKFHDKQASEKQEISIYSSVAKKESNIFLLDFNTDKIVYSVRCTNKSWGIEIAELIRKTLLILFKKNNSLDIRIRRESSESFMFIFFVMVSVWAATFYIFLEIFRMVMIRLGMDSCRPLMYQVKSYVEKDLKLDQKIDLILQLASKCSDKGSFSSAIIYAVSLILSLSLSIWLTLKIIELIQPPDYHFILFTEESKKVRDEYFRKLRDRRIFWSVTLSLGLTLGIISGIIGNYIYSFLTR